MANRIFISDKVMYVSLGMFFACQGFWYFRRSGRVMTWGTHRSAGDATNHWNANIV
jgi:hypothetical protein